MKRFIKKNTENSYYGKNTTMQITCICYKNNLRFMRNGKHLNNYKWDVICIYTRNEMVEG